MTVFRTFLKVLKAYKFVIIMYTVMLVAFAGFNMQTSDSSTNFVASKPDVLIVNNDEKQGITKNFIEYIEKNCNIADVDNTNEAISDALFYRDINYIIYIPSNYREDFLNHKNPKIEVKSTGDYQSSLAGMMLERYVEVANIYNTLPHSEVELIEKINNTLSSQAQVEIKSKLDTISLSKASFYYNFANYSILAGCVYVICLILSSFKSEKIKNRTIVSSMNYKKYNIRLLLCNSLFAITLWMAYVLLSLILIGDIMLTSHGIILIVNSFIFTICASTVALLIGNLVNNNNAINGIVNVIALGSSFLCGAFVPMEFLPDAVLKIARALPSYYYISNNEMIKKLKSIDFETIKPILLNMAIMIAFALVFVVITNIVSSKKRKID